VNHQESVIDLLLLEVVPSRQLGGDFVELFEKNVKKPRVRL
jgi:hypothetical protein